MGANGDDGGKGGDGGCGVSDIDEGSGDGGKGSKVENKDLRCMNKGVCCKVGMETQRELRGEGGSSKIIPGRF